MAQVQLASRAQIGLEAIQELAAKSPVLYEWERMDVVTVRCR